VNYGERERDREREKCNEENVCRCKFIVEPEELHLKSRIAGIDEINENIRLRVWNDTEDHTKGMNEDKVDMNDKEHQKRDKELPILV